MALKVHRRSLNSLLNWERVKLLKGGSDVMVLGGFCDDPSSRVLNQLELMEGLFWEAEEWELQLSIREVTML